MLPATTSDLDEMEDELADAYLPDLDEAIDEEAPPSQGDFGWYRVLAADEPIPQTNISVDLPVSTLIHRKSAFRDMTRNLDCPNSEGLVVAEILAAAARQKVTSGEGREQQMDTEFHEIELDDFCAYGNSAWYAQEMRPLNQLATARFGTDRFFFDGILRGGGIEHRVQGVPFKELPLGNYGSRHDTVGGEVWIRSETNQRRKIYYRLRHPAQEYRRFHEAFLWIADFAKHFVDFCDARKEDGGQVVLADFKSSFIQWLSTVHHHSTAVKKWCLKHGPGSDFRTAVVAHIDFLWKEAFSVLGNAAFRLDLFREVKTFNHYQNQVAPRIRSISQGPYRVASTIVTPYVYYCFKRMRMGDILSPVGDLSTGFHAIAANTQDDELQHDPHHSPVGKQIVDGIRPGQVISTRPDADGESKWKNLTSRGSLEDPRWFVLVQKIHVNHKDNRRSFDVTWLYKPVDTPCGAEVYPHDDELFLSTHCTCEEGRKARIDEADVLGVHKVAWPDGPVADREFFVRQTYITEQRRWITWKRKHMYCPHRDSPNDASRPSPSYCIGDTVLATVRDGQLEPFEVLEILDEQSSYRLRPLPRRCLIETNAPTAPVNELVYTDDRTVLRATAIEARCVVRVFKAEQPITKPYTHGGTGNLFFMTHQLVRAEDGEPT
jgi:DNA (cytosine-5)-methyltransferase 1